MLRPHDWPEHVGFHCVYKLILTYMHLLVPIYIYWTLRAADQKYLESFEMWCWRRMEKISWTDHVRNEEVLFRVNEQRNILTEG
jgi:hypothetical protein